MMELEVVGDIELLGEWGDFVIPGEMISIRYLNEVEKLFLKDVDFFEWDLRGNALFGEYVGHLGNTEYILNSLDEVMGLRIETTEGVWYQIVSDFDEGEDERIIGFTTLRLLQTRQDLLNWVKVQKERDQWRQKCKERKEGDLAHLEAALEAIKRGDTFTATKEIEEGLRWLSR